MFMNLVHHSCSRTIRTTRVTQKEQKSMDKCAAIVLTFCTVLCVCHQQALGTAIRLIGGGEEQNTTSKEIIIGNSKSINNRNVTASPNKADENVTNVEDKNLFKDKNSTSSSVATAVVSSNATTIVVIVVVIPLVLIVALLMYNMYRRCTKGKVTLPDVSFDESSSSKTNGEHKHDDSGSEDENVDKSNDPFITPSYTGH